MRNVQARRPLWRPYKQDGFSLPEMLIATLILAALFTGVLIGLIRGLELSEMTRNSSTALALCKSKVTEIENTPFSQIFATYNNTTFTTPDLNGIGVSLVDNSTPDLLEITVVFCWQQKNGRIIGEDTNLNGQLNGGEDQNGNGALDSPIKVVTLIYGS